MFRPAFAPAPAPRTPAPRTPAPRTPPALQRRIIDFLVILLRDGYTALGRCPGPVICGRDNIL